MIVPKICPSTHDFVLIILGQTTEAQNHYVDGNFLPVLKEINMHKPWSHTFTDITQMAVIFRNANFCVYKDSHLASVIDKCNVSEM